jgi:1-deoxy-D-xylulose-5-phosphate synthase
VRRTGQTVALLAFGSLVTPALMAAEILDATLADMRFVKPLDEALIQQLAQTHEVLVTLEENAVMGGAGSAVVEYLHRAGLRNRVLQLGLPDRFIDHGDHASMLKDCGLDAAGIVASVSALLPE